jgi:hypothetical protein
VAKITSFDPSLPAIGTAYPPEPLQAWPVLFHPPIELAAWRPCGCLDFDRRVDFAAVSFAVLARIVVLHGLFEHDCDSEGRVRHATCLRG